MRAQIFSDLHFDAARNGWVPELATGTDLIVCAGDVCEGLEEGFRFLRGFTNAPIVTVAGNHSFYRRCLPDEIAAGRGAALEQNVFFLENDSLIWEGVRFLGTTLWTDYRLFGDGNRALCLDAARRSLNDHKYIKWRKEPWQRFRPEEAYRLHAAAVAFLERELAVPFDGPTVVVSHHAPLSTSVPDRYASDPISAAYASDLSGLIGQHQPDFWIHGHTHTSFDYMAGDTRVICNPHGYGAENAVGFNPALVVDIGGRP